MEIHIDKMKLRSYNKFKETKKNMTLLGGDGFGKKSKPIEKAKNAATLESGKVYFGKTEDGKDIEIYEDTSTIQKEDTNPPTGYPDMREPIYAKINPGVKKEDMGHPLDRQKFKEDLLKESNKVIWPKGKKERREYVENNVKFDVPKKDTKPDVWKTTPSLSSTKVNGGGGGGAPEKYEIPKGGDLSEVLFKLDEINRKVDYLLKNNN